MHSETPGSQQFVEYVHEALTHFHDRGYLLAHPLTALLTVGPTDAERVEQLRRTLLEAINELKNHPAGQPGSRSWRGHRVLVLRYVEGASTEQITRDLGVTDRQVRRDQREALEVVASILLARHRRLHGDDHNRGESVVAGREATPPAEDALLEAELLKIGAARPESLPDVASVIRGALATAAPLAERRSLQLRATLHTGFPPVAANRAALRQICLGMFSYAIERATGSAVEVEAPVDDTQAGSVGVLQVSFPAVSEQGPEPEPGDDPRLLVPRRLAQLQGGSLIFERRGASLVLRLALPRTSLAAVLVIDDDPDVVRLFRRLVVGHPYQLHQANTGARALQMARQVKPMAILLDVMMLSQDGWEILAQLKRDPELCRIPVVVCSVLRERALAEALGAADFLHKPVSQQALLAALERCRAAS